MKEGNEMKTTRQKMTEYIEALDTKTLKATIKMAFDSLDKHADRVLQATLNELERRLPEPEFVDFCDNL